MDRTIDPLIEATDACKRQAAEIERLKAELDETVEMFHREVAARIKLEAHNATMQRALEDMVTAYGGLGSKPVDFARQALAPDAGKPILDVIKAADRVVDPLRRHMTAAVLADLQDLKDKLDVLETLKPLAALNASRETGDRISRP